MKTQNVTIKNVDTAVVELLREVRAIERRQLAVILEDCVREYWRVTYEDEDQ
jgi:hypothetical protein